MLPNAPTVKIIMYSAPTKLKNLKVLIIFLFSKIFLYNVLL